MMVRFVIFVNYFLITGVIFCQRYHNQVSLVDISLLVVITSRCFINFLRL